MRARNKPKADPEIAPKNWGASFEVFILSTGIQTSYYLGSIGKSQHEPLTNLPLQCAAVHSSLNVVSL
jgi:hypothetical protein